MDSALTTVVLPAALGIIMFGLGLDLTLDDFRRVGRHPKAVLIALFCQLIILPVACFGLVLALDLPPLLGIGMMLLAASPGGTSANLFSHLFRGDVALNVSLTAVNSIIAIITLPVITNLTIAYYDQDGDVSLQFRKVVEVFAVVLVPVVIGMFVRSARPAFAERADKPVRIASALILAALVIAIVFAERENVAEYLGQVGVVAAAFCLLSLTVGYYVPRLVGVTKKQSIACSMEIGVHNATLAIYVAINALEEVEASIPAAVYSIFMFIFAAGWGYAIRDSAETSSESDPGPSSGNQAVNT